MTEILVITNASAGTHEEEAIAAAVEVLSSEHVVDVRSSRDVEELRGILAEEPPIDTLVVIGGDGSLHAAISALHDMDRLSTVSVGLVPMGTGNDFARTVGMSEDAATAAKQLLTGTPRDIDVIVDDRGRVVVNAIHVGLGAEASAAAAPWKRLLGAPGYLIGVLLSGFRHRGASLIVKVDGETVHARGKVIQVAAGNGRFVGGGAELLPDADPSDGAMDIAVSYANPWHRRIGYLLSLRRGEHLGRDDVVFARGAEMEVSGDSFRCSADGEIGEPTMWTRWTIVPSAVTMMLP